MAETKKAAKTSGAAAKKNKTLDKTVAEEPVKQVKKSKTGVYWLIGLGLLIILALIFFRRQIVVATVNGKPIFWYKYIQVLEKQGGKEILDQLVLEKLIVDEAAKQNLVVANEVVEDELNKIKTNLEAQNMTIDEALGQQGMTLAELQKQIQMRQLVTQLASKDITVSDQEIADYLEENKDSMPTGKDKPENLNELVKEQLLKNKQQEAVQKFLDNLKSQATVQYW